MMHEEYQEKGVTYIWINKTKARVKYNEGKTIYLIQDMMRLPNAWKKPCPIHKDGLSSIGREFDDHVKDFQYYNGDSQRGHGIKYCIKQEEL